MSKQPEVLVFDNTFARGTPYGVMVSGWMKVSEELAQDTAMVLNKLQSGTCDPWLQPRHDWMLKNGSIYAYIDNIESGQLWTEHEKTAAIAEKGVAALERIMQIVTAATGTASCSMMAESADRLRKAGIPIMGED
jgi:hypothetical protein